ncbi:MAG: RNA 2',3'-cyclic phosphodiesterase [Spirochaetia bacterium]
MRVFTAVPVPESLQEEIIVSTASLRGRYPRLKWVSQQALHITLNFLGEIEEETAPQILDTMKAVKPAFNSFSLEFRGLGVFPRRGPARVVYLEPQRGIQQCQKLQQALARQLAVYAPPERKKFKPHLTIARVKSHTDWPEPENEGANIAFSFTVQRVVLYKSILKPDGAHYEEVGAITAQIS